MQLTESFQSLLQVFRDVFTAPTYATFVTIAAGWCLSPDMEFDNEMRTPGLITSYSEVHFLRWVTSRSMTLCRLSQSAGRLRNWLPSRSEITHSLRFGSYITYTSFLRWIRPT
jgi:hypothetical protein